MFDRFEEFDIATTDTSIHGCRGGDGPPLPLLHGIPETHLMWHRVALRLAERYTVVATDLRGYGDSGKPPGTADHEPYSMHAIGRDQLKVMQHLGYGRFGVVGHDRGACCAYRLALDHPNAVLRLAVMDVVPVGDAYNRADKDFSLLYRQWSLLAAPEPAPEQFINAAPANLVDFMLDTWSEVTSFPSRGAREYIDKFSHPDTVHAICEEFRASATWDYQQDEADRGNRWISCPVLFLWSQRGAVGKLYGDRSRSGRSGPMTFAASRCRSVTSFQKRRRRKPHAGCWIFRSSEWGFGATARRAGGGSRETVWQRAHPSSSGRERAASWSRLRRFRRRFSVSVTQRTELDCRSRRCAFPSRSRRPARF
ncbi:alpha/beta fold hydrolase [Streptomyces sp. NPDC001296]